MFYGRRAPESLRTQQAPGHQRFILNKAFQYKYAWYMITAVAGGVLLFFLPAYYFLQQNYHLFSTLAYDSAPTLLSHLDREVTWLQTFFISSFVFVAAMTLILSIRMTRNILSPLIRMEKHLHQLMLGHWSIPDFKMHENDDFRELSMTYDYFYRSLKANTEAELKLLEKLNVDPHNREAYAAWKSLVSMKKSRLGIEETAELAPNENVANLIEFGQRRRAS